MCCFTPKRSVPDESNFNSGNEGKAKEPDAQSIRNARVSRSSSGIGTASNISSRALTPSSKDEAILDLSDHSKDHDHARKLKHTDKKYTSNLSLVKRKEILHPSKMHMDNGIYEGGKPQRYNERIIEENDDETVRFIESNEPESHATANHKEAKTNRSDRKVYTNKKSVQSNSSNTFICDTGGKTQGFIKHSDKHISGQLEEISDCSSKADLEADKSAMNTLKKTFCKMLGRINSTKEQIGDESSLEDNCSVFDEEDEYDRRAKLKGKISSHFS